MTCESCNEREAVTRCVNPDFNGYELCDACATEYDSRSDEPVHCATCKVKAFYPDLGKCTNCFGTTALAQD